MKAKYSVRVGKKKSTVYVLTPAGVVYRLAEVLPKREKAVAVARKVRAHLRKGGKLDSRRWLVMQQVNPSA